MPKTPALFSALAVSALVVTALAGCASAPTVAYSSGDASSIVKVSGAASLAPTATFPTPLVATTSQVTVDRAGTGATIQEGDQVDFEYTVFAGSTGETLGGSAYGASGQASPRVGVVSESNARPATSIIRSLLGAKSGERFTLVTTAKAGFGAGALSSNGIADSATLVIVVDVKDHFIGKANGTNLLPLDGMPSVVTAVDGQPGIVIQELSVPTQLRIETVKAGSGAVVKKNDTVHVKYTGWTWPTVAGDKPTVWPGDASTQEPGGSASWTDDRAVDLKVSSSSLPPGLYKSLLGAKVGSQVLAVIPPKDGFPSGSAPSGVDSSSTIIMVFDILGIA